MTSVFINPRSLISSSNVDTLLLKSSLSESRLTFVNSGSATGAYQSVPNPQLYGKNILLQPILNSGTPVFTLSSSGYNFSVLQNNNPIAQFYANTSTNQTQFNIYGPTYSSNFGIINGAVSRKAIILSDYNNQSIHQFSGIGYTYDIGLTYGITNYQVPARNAIHAFYAGASATSSVEWMRIQENNLGYPQLGIGTSVFTSNVALEVSGNVHIKGDLTFTGGFYGASIDTSSFVTVNSNTGRISSNILPQKLVFLNTNNLIDNSLLNNQYNFQYLKTQKNVGIGIKNPLQKLQVQGTGVFSDRLGINNVYPSARIHAIENVAVIPTAIFENNTGGDLLQTFISGSPAVYLCGTHPGIGIGTSNIPLNTSLQVNGNVNVTGIVSCCNLNLQYISGQTINITDPIAGPILRLQTITLSDNTTTLALRSSVQLQVYSSLSSVNNPGGISTDYISAATGSTVRILNSSLSVDNTLTLNSSPIISSDSRLKFEINSIENALDKIDAIHGYTFRYKYSNEKSGGILAQELITVLPEAVKSLPNGYYGVQYDVIIGLLIECIRELKAKIQ
uniref:Peptidase S74 domain-containing protein n=1 Tax=viral metagenome TaxID=1070528 RepID=A0A6C0KS55_9ZZZZ